MAFLDTELGLLVCGLAILSIHLAVIVRYALVRGSCGLRASLAAGRARFAGLFSRNAWQREKPDLIEVCVVRHVNARIEKNVRYVLRMMANVYAFVSLTVVWNMCLDVPRWMTTHQTLILFTQCLTSNMLLVLPWPKHCLGLWFSFTMVCAASWIAFSEGQMIMFFSVASHFFVRFISGCAYAHLPLVVIWNAVYVVVSLFSYSTSEITDASVTFRMFALYEIVMAVLACWCANGSKKAMFAEARREIQASMLKGESSAMTTMLNLVCDVSLELDANLKVKEDSPDFAALFMMNSDASVAGMELQHFMPSEEDKSRYENSILSTSSDAEQGALAGLVQVKMRDSLGSEVGVELFYVQYQLLGHKHYLVGLRESADASIAELKIFKKIKQQRKREHRVEDDTHNTTPSGEETKHQAQTIGKAGERPAGRGTRAALPKDSLKTDEEASDCSSDCDSEVSIGSKFSNTSSGTTKASSTTDRQSDSGLTKTIAKAKRVALYHVMRTWHLGSRERWCCQFHAHVMELRRTVSSLEKNECSSSFSTVTGVQCMRCGTLVECDTGKPAARQHLRCQVCRSQRFRNNVILGL